MYAKSLFVASALAVAASLASAEPEQPRIYVPQVVKREDQQSAFTPSTLITMTSAQRLDKREVKTEKPTTGAAGSKAPESQQAPPSQKPSESQQKPTPNKPSSQPQQRETTQKESSKRDEQPTSAKQVTSKPDEKTTSQKRATSMTEEKSTSSKRQPSSQGGEKSSSNPITPKPTEHPTSKREESSSHRSTSKREAASSEKSSSKRETEQESSTSKRAPVTTQDESLSSLISEILSSINSVPVSAGTGTGSQSAITLQPTPTSQRSKGGHSRPPKSSGGGIVIGPTGIVTSSSAPASTSSGGGILDPIGTLISDLFPGPPKSTSTPDISFSLSVPGPSATANSTPPASTDGGIGLPPILSSLLDPLTTLLPIGGDPTSTSTSDASFPVTTTSQSPIISIPISIPISLPSNPTSVPGITILPPPSSSSSSIDIPIVNSTAISEPTTLPPLASSSTAVVILPSGSSSSFSVNDTLPGVTSSAPAVSVPTIVPVNNATESKVILPPTSSAPLTTVAPVTSVAPVATEDVTSIQATATLTNTELQLPTSLVIAASTLAGFTPQTGSPTGTASATGLPSSVPKVIWPNNGDQPVPDGFVTLQIGFLYPLNYIFVASNTVAASQIFNFLPKALSYASGVDASKLQVTKLVPYDTTQTWGYVTTIAKFNYPATLVDTLQMDIWSPSSELYNNPDAVVRNLTSLINPKIDLHGNVNNNGGAGGGGGSSNGGSNPGDTFKSNGSDDSSPKQTGKTVGIAVGAAAFAALYGAGMFMVARRYKRKRQGHRRASSITNSQGSAEMRYTGTGSPALMGGALMGGQASNYGGMDGSRDSYGSGRQSARNAGISAPVATENSLGWS